MRTEAHWDECDGHNAYINAQVVCLELKDIAKNSGFDPRGVKIHSKKKAMALNIGRIGAMITWDEGPEGWLDMCELPIEICTSYKDSMLIFYD